MKIKSLLGILIVIIVGILIVIPRSYFVKNNIKNPSSQLRDEGYIRGTTLIRK